MTDQSNNGTPAAGETDLGLLMAKMSPRLDARTFVFVTIEREQLVAHIDQALMVFRESEGVTLILEEKYARSAGLDAVFPCRQITLAVHSALEAVGFLAAIIPILAKQGMGVNPVSGYFHDHLFVPAEKAEQALTILQNLSVNANDA
ncbi:MAG: ACT domain-containing protein [Granulosicoccaceae bacterium]